MTLVLALSAALLTSEAIPEAMVQAVEQVESSGRGVALKVIDDKVQKLLAKWSTLAETAQDEVVGKGIAASKPDLDDFGGVGEDA